MKKVFLQRKGTIFFHTMRWIGDCFLLKEQAAGLHRSYVWPFDYSPAQKGR
jgi:hypothetical protein